MIDRECQQCKKRFGVLPSVIKNGRGKFCSRTCWKDAKWKGDNVSYHTLHQWVKYWRGTPNTCEKCGDSQLQGCQIHWANKSGLYKRDLSDWIRLCADCHNEYDRDLSLMFNDVIPYKIGV